MKHLRKFNERIDSKKGDITEEMIMTCFAHVFDIAKSYKIYESSLEEEDYSFSQGSYNSYCIDIEHSFYAESSLSEFKKYLSIINEIDEAIEKIQKIYKVDIIIFEERSNDKITINLANR